MRYSRRGHELAGRDAARTSIRCPLCSQLLVALNFFLPLCLSGNRAFLSLDPCSGCLYFRLQLPIYAPATTLLFSFSRVAFHRSPFSPYDRPTYSLYFSSHLPLYRVAVTPSLGNERTRFRVVLLRTRRLNAGAFSSD